MTDSEMLTEAMHQARPVVNIACYRLIVVGLAAPEATSAVRGFSYALQDLCNSIASRHAQLVD